MNGRRNMMLSVKNRAAFVVFLLSALIVLLCAGLFVPSNGSVARAEDDTTVNNELLDASGNEYALPGNLVYGSIGEISAPHMRYESDENEIGYSLYFTYRYDEEVRIGEAFTTAEFSYYLNGYMPAGQYRLTATYGATEMCAPFEKDLTFTVQTKNYDYSSPEETLDTELLNRTFTFDYTGEVLLPEVSAQPIEYDRGTADTSFWATAGADEYFAGDTVTYRVSDTANNGHYHTKEELSNSAYMAGNAHRAEVAPFAAGRYRISYRAEAANYTPSENTEKYFDVVIIETLAVPTIGNEVYTGYPIHPKFEESRNYYAMYPANGCIDATTYCITFVLRDASYYKWAGSALGDPVAETTFTIEKADNAWNAPPSIANWTYGNYREEINSPFSAPRFIEAGASVTYRYIESNEAGEELGEPSEEVPVDAGWYYLVAELSEGGNYKALTGRTHFEILQATNLWEVTPSITSWRFSEYDETVNRPVGRATSGETQFMFYRLDQDGERVGEGVASMEAFRRDTDGEIPAGSYLMYVWVDETRNYTASHAEVPFHVFKAYNQWTTTPTIVRWYYGQYSVENDVPKAVPLYGKAEDVTYSFYLADADGKPTGEEVVGNMNGFRNEDGKVPAGEYILVASLAASDDYEAMRTEILFSILQVNNYWEEAPNITRWNQGTYNAVTNAISGKAAYGQVTFTVKDADGNVQTDLASLKAGTYTLTASVEGTSDYTDLESTIAFVVFSPVGGDENVVAIVASILLGVACLGLISAFIALFIHYKKNYE